MSNYTSKDIKVLSDITHVRTRPGMYIGETDNPKSLFNEIFDNAVDEASISPSKIQVVVEVDTRDSRYTVRDTGRGIPQGLKKLESGEELETIEVLVTKAFSGGKFDNTNYHYSTGLNGIGMLVTNALSSYFEVTSCRSNRVLRYVATQGETESLKASRNTTSYGSHWTEVVFQADPKIFDSVKIPIDHIKNRCRIASAFGINITLIVDNKEVDINSELQDLVPLDKDSKLLGIHIHEVVDKNTNEKIIYGLAYTNESSYEVNSYTNLLYNSQNGSHERFLWKCIKDAWKYYKVPDVQDGDYALGLKLLVAVFIQDTSFSSQTKDKLTVNIKSFDKFKTKIVNDIWKWLRTEDDLRKLLIARFQEHRASLNRLKSSKKYNQLIVVNDNLDQSNIRRRSSVVKKLRECTSSSRSNTELYLTEGDSAMGTILQARNIKTQAVLPLRGKILNVVKLSDYFAAFKNEEVLSITNALGCGVFDECDAGKSRYERLIFGTDADEDGKQIAALLVGLAVKLYPTLVKSGMVYIAQPPLYGWREKGVFNYSNNFEDIPNKSNFTRFKGLGEMDADELRVTMMDSSTRTLVQVQYPEDEDEFDQVLTSASYKFSMLEELGVIKYK